MSNTEVVKSSSLVIYTEEVARLTGLGYKIVQDSISHNLFDFEVTMEKPPFDRAAHLAKAREEKASKRNQ